MVSGILTIGPSLQEDGLTLCFALLGPSLLDCCLVSLEYGPQVMVTDKDSVGSVLSQALSINWRHLAHEGRIEWAFIGHWLEFLGGILPQGCVLGTAEVDLMLSARLHRR